MKIKVTNINSSNPCWNLKETQPGLEWHFVSSINPFCLQVTLLLRLDCKCSLLSSLLFILALLLLLLLLSCFSGVWLCVTPWTAAYQASPSMGFSRQEQWNGLPFPSPMHESGKWKKSLSRVWLLTTPWTAAYQAPPSMGFSGQQYWSGEPLPSPHFGLSEHKKIHHRKESIWPDIEMLTGCYQVGKVLSLCF